MKYTIIFFILLIGCSSKNSPTEGVTKIPNLIKYNLVNETNCNTKAYIYINRNLNSIYYNKDKKDTLKFVFNYNDSINSIKIDIATSNNIYTLLDTALTNFEQNVLITTLPKQKVNQSNELLTSKSGYIKDSRDNKIYRYDTFGNDIWLVENLKYVTDQYGIHQYITDSINEVYYTWTTALQIDSSYEGRLYFDSTASVSTNPIKGIAPSGWHIPSLEEFYSLHDIIISNNETVKAKDFWNPTPQLNTRFYALPIGYYCTGTMFNLFEEANFWTTDEKDSATGYGVSFKATDEKIYRTYGPKHLHFSIRCVKDR